jgi:hypothetical protein
MSPANTNSFPAGSGGMLEDLLHRVRAEFLEMPGLRVTRAQARRLWALEPALCEAVLTTLVEANFLVESRNASFMRPSV